MYTTTTYFTEYDRLQEEQNAEIRRSRPFQHAIRLMKADVTFWLILAIMQCIDVIREFEIFSVKTDLSRKVTMI